MVIMMREDMTSKKRQNLEFVKVFVINNMDGAHATNCHPAIPAPFTMS